MMEAVVAARPAKKLLVLDVNGLLVATYHKHDKRPAGPHHAKLGNFYVYKRPSCEEFLKFCLENFVVGIWSSAREHNVNLFVNFIFKDLKQSLAFSWYQQHCTITKVKHPDNKNKPIFLKELSKLWAKLDPKKFGPSNSLLVDDSPYKALKNPPNTAIFPRSYTANEADDNFLGVLQKYLEGLRDSLDVQKYVRENPIGEPSITSESPFWSIFSSIVSGDSSTTQVAQAIQDVNGHVQEAGEDVKHLFEKTSEYTDVQYAGKRGKRRRFSPTSNCDHSKRVRVQDLPETADLTQEHEGNAFSEQSQDDDLSKNGYHSWRHKGRIRERERGRERDRERSRSSQRHQDYRDRIDADRDRYVPSSSYLWERNSSRDGSYRGNYYRYGTSAEAARNRDTFVGGQHRDHMGYGAQGERQFAPTRFNDRDLQPHIVPLTGQHIYGISSQPKSHIGHSGQTEHTHHKRYQGEMQFNNGASGTRPDYDRRWQGPAYLDKSTDYDPRWNRGPVSQYVASPPSIHEYNDRWSTAPLIDFGRTYHPAEGNVNVGNLGNNRHPNWDTSNPFRHTRYSSNAGGFQ